jgi:hypothetical protein
MTATEIVRLGVLEAKVDDIVIHLSALRASITGLDAKMTDAFVNKADRDYVERLREIVVEKASASDIKDVKDEIKGTNALITKLIIAVAGTALTTLLGIAVLAVFGK